MQACVFNNGIPRCHIYEADERDIGARIHKSKNRWKQRTLGDHHIPWSCLEAVDYSMGVRFCNKRYHTLDIRWEVPRCLEF